MIGFRPACAQDDPVTSGASPSWLPGRVGRHRVHTDWPGDPDGRGVWPMRPNHVKDGSSGCAVGTNVNNRMRYKKSTRPIPGSQSALAGDFPRIFDPPKAPKREILHQQSRFLRIRMVRRLNARFL